MPPVPETLGARIAELRQRRGLLQKELARRASLSVSFLSEVENDKRGIGTEALLELAEVLGASLDYLVRGEHRSAPESEPLAIPRGLAEAAERGEWSYSVTASLLQAQQSVVARRNNARRPDRPHREWTCDEWIQLYNSLFPHD